MVDAAELGLFLLLRVSEDRMPLTLLGLGEMLLFLFADDKDDVIDEEEWLGCDLALAERLLLDATL